MNGTLLHELAATANVFSAKKFETDDAMPSIAFFPVVGLIIGFLFTLAAWAATTLYGSLFASFFAAILLTLLYELATDWTGLKSVTSYLSLRAGNIPAAAALVKKIEPQKKITPIFLFISIYLLRMLAFGTITYHSPVLFLLVFTGAYFIRAELAAYSTDDSEPLLELPEEKKYLPHLITFAVFVTAAFLSFSLKIIAASLLTAFVIALILYVQRRSIQKHTGRAGVRQIHIYGYCAETILLFTGIIVL